MLRVAAMRKIHTCDVHSVGDHLSKDALIQAPSKYTFDLYHEDGTLKQADLSKCQRDDSNCIEKIERTKIDVTWIFKVDPVDPRMDWK